MNIVIKSFPRLAYVSPALDHSMGPGPYAKIEDRRCNAPMTSLPLFHYYLHNEALLIPRSRCWDWEVHRWTRWPTTLTTAGPRRRPSTPDLPSTWENTQMWYKHLGGNLIFFVQVKSYEPFLPLLRQRLRLRRQFRDTAQVILVLYFILSAIFSSLPGKYWF